MIIGLCGTHGTGKSTVIQGLKDRGISTNTIQISRTAQSLLGWDKLSVAKQSVEDMWKLQNAIIHLMEQRDIDIVQSGITTVVERTPADVWAYTLLWCKHHNININDNGKAIQFYLRCLSLSKFYKKFIVVPISEKIEFSVDSARADKESRLEVAQSIYSFLEKNNLTYSILNKVDATDRINEALLAINHL